MVPLVVFVGVPVIKAVIPLARVVVGARLPCARQKQPWQAVGIWAMGAAARVGARVLAREGGGRAGALWSAARVGAAVLHVAANGKGRVGGGGGVRMLDSLFGLISSSREQSARQSCGI